VVPASRDHEKAYRSGLHQLRNSSSGENITPAGIFSRPGSYAGTSGEASQQHVPVPSQAKETKTMNKDQVTGKVEQVSGRVKQGVGGAVGNQKLANQGVADQVKGVAKETWGNAKDAAAVTADRHQHEAERHADDVRAAVSQKVDELHDKVNEKIDIHKAKERQKTKTA